MTGIYIHIPYCRTICPYCDFVRNRLSGSVPAPFIDALCAEIAGFDGPEEVGTVFFGGGTPSLIDPAALERVLTALRDRFRMEAADGMDTPEITVEANPDDLTPELADAWLRLGVNRVSLGVQSFNDDALRFLGRRHDAAAAQRACELVAERFDNWSLDLIFGAHPLDAWPETLRRCVALAPPHVSAYGLTYEAGTPFEKRADRAIDDDAWVQLYRATRDALAGWERYEISNFARPGYRCRHNLLYWHNEAYIGFGPAAYSYVDGVRSRNVVATDAYLAQPGAKTESLALSDAEIRLETVIQHLRLKDGLPRAYYRKRFEREIDDDFGDALRALLAKGLIEDTGDVIRPTEHGFELNNEIGLGLIA